MMWKSVAEVVLGKINSATQYDHQKSVGVSVEWRGDVYLGWIQNPLPELPEVVALRMVVNPLPRQLFNAVRSLEPNRSYLHADGELDLFGREKHFVRLLEDRLTVLTGPQAELVVHYQQLSQQLPEGHVEEQYQTSESW